MNTHESYVSLETARLLKQAGFDWECRGYYYACNAGKEVSEVAICPYPDNHNAETPFSYFAPTLAVAQRWVREVKKRNVIVSYIPSWQYAQRYHAYIAELNMNVGESECDNYEAALEAGIQKCLTLMLE